VILVEVSKQTHQQKGLMTRVKRSNPIRVLEGLSNPVAEPA
jgi:oligoribonuclease (3'-5' exoribonuclease)